MGVKRKNPALRDQLNEVLARKADVIGKMLENFGVPMVVADSNRQ